MSGTSYAPSKGDIIWIDLDPRTGHEQSGRRPAIVLSEKLLYTQTGFAIICPITSKIKGLLLEIELNGTKTKGVILPMHVRSVDLSARHIKFIESAPTRIVDSTISHILTLIGAG